jgi:3-oxoacyl-[acyl-carrier-protein] synthase II
MLLASLRIFWVRCVSRRVVVTGLGIVSPLGHNVCDTWDSLVAGKSGITRVTRFDPEGFASQVAGEVKGFDATVHLDKKLARRTDRTTQFTLVAADEAVKQAGLHLAGENDGRVACIIGTAIGGITTLVDEFQTMEAKGPDRVSPFLIPMMLPDMSSGQLSIRMGAKAVNYSLISACASGADSLGEAANIIRRGDADVALAGGTEACISPIVFAGFSAARALTTLNADPPASSRPFDVRRDGFVMAEGAAVLVLESEEHARARDAHVLAEFAGYCATSDAFHITQPDDHGDGARRAMEGAIAQARLAPDDIDYVNAHGTSTPMNDRLETVALKRVFGEYAYTLPISSTKSMTGHLLGAAGALEAAVSVLTIQHGIIPPTINLDDPDPDCDLDYVPNAARSATVDAVLSNSLGFGGHNATLVFRRYEPS